MKIDQFRNLVTQLWNQPQFFPVIKSLLGVDWEKQVSSLAKELSPQHLWMAAHELGLAASFPKVDRPHYPFLMESDIGDRKATLGLTDNCNYLRFILDSFELVPCWENEENLNIDADILLAWEAPDQDPESRFSEFKEHVGWNLEIRLLTPTEAWQTMGQLMLGQTPVGTIYVNPLPMLSGNNLKSLKDIGRDLLILLGDKGDGLGYGDGGLSDAPETTVEQDVIEVVQRLDWVMVSFSLPNILGTNWVDRSLKIVKESGGPRLFDQYRALLNKNLVK